MMRFDPDLWLLSRVFVPLTRFAGRRWGATVPGLVRGCVIPFAAFGIAGAAELAIRGRTWPAAGMLFWVAITSLMLITSARDAQVWPNSNYLSLWSARVTGMVVALVFLVLAALDVLGAALAGFCFDVSYLAYVVGIYIAACPPASPQHRRVRHVKYATT